MQKLGRSETRLLVIFSAMVFLALNLIAWKLWTASVNDLQGKVSAAKGDLAEGAATIAAASTLRPAAQWIHSHPMPECTADQASTKLLQMARSAAETNGLKIVEETLLPSVSVLDKKATSLQLKLSGPFAGVARFLFALQGPEAWRAIDKLTVRSDNEPPNVVVDLTIRQYYSPGS